jgi:peptidyl-prolyl cis-trans isomerase B (cyclophilin B)
MSHWLGLALLLVVFLAGCAQSPANEETGEKNRIAVVQTNKGKIVFELYEKRAPITTANFIKLAESGFYDGLTFHRVVPGFVAQGGDPEGTGMGGSDEKIPLEINPELTHKKGAVGMARSQDPNSASSQFYFALEDIHELDGSYAVFGQVIEGMDVVESLAVGDVMEKVTIEKQ